MDWKGFEPLTIVCKTNVLPLTLPAHKRPRRDLNPTKDFAGLYTTIMYLAWLGLTLFNLIIIFLNKYNTIIIRRKKLIYY